MDICMYIIYRETQPQQSDFIDSKDNAIYEIDVIHNKLELSSILYVLYLY